MSGGRLESQEGMESNEKGTSVEKTTQFPTVKIDCAFGLEISMALKCMTVAFKSEGSKCSNIVLRSLHFQDKEDKN